MLSWYEEETQPTLKQVEHFARTTHTPVGYLFLSDPPVEKVPIPDLRTVAGGRIGRPSPDLLDTLYLCQQRQDWYRDHLRILGETPLPFVGSADLFSDVASVAAAMRRVLDFDLEARRRAATWTDALRTFIGNADGAGVLVMVSGIVSNNTHRKLDPQEFRGFALSDRLAPLVFVNGADTKAAQMFTLAHELAHIWLGESALSDDGPLARPAHRIEAWCNRVAAELLVPLDALRQEHRPEAELGLEVPRLARVFKVSRSFRGRAVVDSRPRARHWRPGCGGA